MKLDVDLRRLEKVRSKLGVEREMHSTLPKLAPSFLFTTLLKELREGILIYSLSYLARRNNYLFYRGMAVAVYLWQFDGKSPRQLRTKRFRNKRYHVICCPAMKKLLRDEYKGKLMIVRRDDNQLRVDSGNDEETLRVEFPVCYSCLRQLKLIKFWHFPMFKRRVAVAFQMENFLNEIQQEAETYPSEFI